MESKMLYIGELARRLGVNTKTIRYYESINLLPEPKRTANNYRVYAQDVENRLQFIKKAKSLGFTLREINEILILSDKGYDPCVHVGELLRKRCADVEKKLTELKDLRTKLKRIEREFSKTQFEDCNTGDLICPKIQKYFKDN